MSVSDLITVIIPSSPIPSHPSSAKIEIAISSIRKHLPDVEVLIQLDGVRKENENRREAYEEYKRNLVWKCNHEFHNVLPIVFPEYLHQTEMMHRTIPMIKTPLLMFLEHDWEILNRPIDWDAMCNAIQKGAVNHVRLCRWTQIHPAHEYLVVGRDSFEGFPFVKIQQWSGHPHIAGVEYYKRLLSNTSRNTRSLLETWAYGLTQGVPWDVWKTTVYNPEGDMKRIEHTDGREGDPVFEPQL